MISLTALVITYNERENIARSLAALSWVERVLLIDSYSSDGTPKLAKQAHPGVEVVQHAFDSFAAQCNLGLSLVRSEWVLSIDADYILTRELIDELRQLVPAQETAGYSAGFRYLVFGHPLRSTLYPPRTVLYRRAAATYRDEGHGHRVAIQGEVRPLKGLIDHDDRKPLSRWIRSQDSYARVEAEHLRSTPDHLLPIQDRLRKRIFVAPVAMPLLLLVGRGLIWDGWRGWLYVCQRTIAELLLSLRLLISRHELEEELPPPSGESGSRDQT